ncbi:uncharacterized protein LOC121875103 isoform X1 [Homarus americanus]|uniref:uncharacterized protein LOC121875103 isoform X1 n=3 Tax=Homarus americanus TaxID=6706 RepID=UPI001C456FAF|nr:uncharacterized protein LOC121875103 isoform X1 [Homarus americanus]XP_042235382.1 uncharacterized protein LOC121875103 isoform X1 [Homarus americanus]XP_042235383.1 uncharacterized protein LOC121875103 isoform X1 [Homarus americanus]XP_042235384.1 uncharacterized protein LOC121875103 isoform X1 [Homarus americanus]XP_042235386.1 uncharacterized protein LOC121875103 isoform X1 [Homarus americanus]XP_042235387.1 uncharacterized protein LOC121875103 isoform X1 [Homarus americanus]
MHFSSQEKEKVPPLTSATSNCSDKKGLLSSFDNDSVKKGKLTKLSHSKVSGSLSMSSVISSTQNLNHKKPDFDTAVVNSRKSSRVGGRRYKKYTLISSDDSGDHISCSSGSDEEYTPYGKKRITGYIRDSRKHAQKMLKTRVIKRKIISSGDSLDTTYEEPLWSAWLSRYHKMLMKDEKVIINSEEGGAHWERSTEGQHQRPEEVNDEHFQLLEEDVKDEKEAWERNNEDSKIDDKKSETDEEGIPKEIDNENKLMKQLIKRRIRGKTKRRRRFPLPLKNRVSRLCHKTCKFTDSLSFQNFPYMMRVLLSLVYLAVLLGQEHFLLMDLLRWCQEGHLPYLSASYLVNSAVRGYVVNIYLMQKTLQVPSSSTVRKLALQMSIFLSLQGIPLPPVEGVIVHLVRLLRLPEQVITMAQELVALKGKEKHEKRKVTLELPSVESLAMAALVVSLKICCGINDLVEHHLSAVATRINAQLGSSHSFSPIFSWDDWKIYINKLQWFCTQVNPFSGFMSSMSEVSVYRKSSTFLPKLSQILTLCRSSPTIYMTDDAEMLTQASWSVFGLVGLAKYASLSSIVELQSWTLQEVFDEAFIGRATYDPLIGIVKQYTTPMSEEEAERSPDLLKIGQDLLQVSFNSHQLYWTQEITHIQQNLKECGSQIILIPVVYPKSQHGKDCNGNGNRESRSDEIGVASSNEVDSLDSSPHFSDYKDNCRTSTHWEQDFINSSLSPNFDNEDTNHNIFCSATDSSSPSTSSEGDGPKKNIFGSSTDGSSNSSDSKSSPHSNTNINSTSEDTSSASSVSKDDDQTKIDMTCASVDASSDSSDSESEKVEKILRNECHSSGNIVRIPMPVYRVWRSNSTKRNLVDVWNTLPTNFKWLITLGSLLCMVSKEELVNDVDILEELCYHPTCQ